MAKKQAAKSAKASTRTKARGRTNSRRPGVPDNASDPVPAPGATSHPPATMGSLDDYRAADYNPRAITPEALAGLIESLTEFGDLSGLIVNRRTGNRIAGHQRTAALAELQAGRAIEWHRDVEIEPRHCATIIKRWEDFTGQTARKIN